MKEMNYDTKDLTARELEELDVTIQSKIYDLKHGHGQTNAVSRLEGNSRGQSSNMNSDGRSFEEFRADFGRHKGITLTGKTYEELIRSL